MNLNLENIGEMVEERIIKGTPIKLESRTFYPIIQISKITIEGEFYFKSILPIAIAVLEPTEKYIISLKESNFEKAEPELDQICEELGIKTKLNATHNRLEYDEF